MKEVELSRLTAALCDLSGEILTEVREDLAKPDRLTISRVEWAMGELIQVLLIARERYPWRLRVPRPGDLILSLGGGSGGEENER